MSLSSVYNTVQSHVLCGPHASDYCYCQFLCKTIILCPKDKASQHPYPSFDFFLLSLTQCFLN